MQRYSKALDMEGFTSLESGRNKLNRFKEAQLGRKSIITTHALLTKASEE